MRIVVDARPYFMRTGIARYTRAMLQTLTALDTRHEWRLLISNHHKIADLPPLGPRVSAQVSEAPWLGGFRERRVLEREAASWRADVFYSMFPPIACDTCPSVVTVFDLIACSHPELLPARVARAARVAADRAIPRARSIVAISRATADAVRRRYASCAADIVVSPCGVAREIGEPDQRFTTARRTGVLFVGTIEPRKNVPLIVEAARALPDVRFTLAGKTGWGDYDLAAHIRDLPNVTWLGRVDDERLARAYAEAALFVYPSRVEGFGLPVLEAIRAGALPIVSADPALREIVPEDRLVVDSAQPGVLAERIAFWLSHPAEQAAVMSSLVEHARQFTWESGARVALDALERAGAR
jgi:glycosyltransferase involved in cell wall biosynthesis